MVRACAVVRSRRALGSRHGPGYACAGAAAAAMGIGQDGLMPGSGSSAVLPVIDVGPLVGRSPAAARAGVAGQIQAACRERGFFYVTGHGVPAGLLDQLADASAEFFALP